MKRALAILLATILCLGLLSACSPAGEQTTASTTPSATQPSTAATEPETTPAPETEAPTEPVTETVPEEGTQAVEPTSFPTSSDGGEG